MISAVELGIMTAQTKAFIDADYEDIVIEPRETKTSDGAGGWTMVSGPDLAPVRVRLIPQSDKVPEQSSLEGRRKAPEFVLVALPGADIQRYDRFNWRGNTWEIAQVHDKPEYELKGDVVLHAVS